jgi:hypothetical protein
MEKRTDGHTTKKKPILVFANLRRRLNSIQNQIGLHNSIFPNTLYFLYVVLRLFNILYPKCFDNVICLQNWGDYIDMSQSVLACLTYAGDVLLICWFGTQLTQHVRRKGFVIIGDAVKILFS